MRRTAFVSSSFAHEDKPLVAIFFQLLADAGLTCRDGEVVPNIPHDILRLIDECEVFVCILTPRTLDVVSSAVSFEVGAAVHARKNMIVLRQREVPVQTMYADRAQIPFDRNSVTSGDKTELDRINDAIRELLLWYGLSERNDPDIDMRFELAKREAHQLGSTVMAYFHDSLYVNSVRDGTVQNFPTEADEEANQIIKNAIRRQTLTRRDGVISEEEIKDPSLVKRLVLEKEFVWIVDPLDGTLNFAYGFPFFCVSLGLLRHGTPVMGVIYDPTAQELYSAVAGRQAEAFDFKTGVRRTLLLESSHGKGLSDAIVMTHLSSNADARAVTIKVLDQLMRTCRGVRMLGSGQMALAALARGQFDVFFNYQTHIWDIVPGYVILKGAGGFATSSLREDEQWTWQSRGVVAAASKAVGQEFVSLIRRHIPGEFPQYT
jgi:fructose-1,6-bisphosphatase/inositol monophosphatase family enzyme